MIARPGTETTSGESHVGTRQVVAEAGFVQVGSPTVRRVVMRVELTP